MESCQQLESSNRTRLSIFLRTNNVINESGNNISNILPNTVLPNQIESLVPHLINVVGDYSPLFFGLLLICGIASLQSTSIIYISSSALLTRDIVKKFFIKNMNKGLPKNFNPIEFGSWMGGDRDGNSNVTSKVTKEVILLSRWEAAKLYEKALTKIIRANGARFDQVKTFKTDLT